MVDVYCEIALVFGLRFGYEYLGAEELYSGMHGEPLKTHIYMGVVYYQRLRHMVVFGGYSLS